MSLNDVCVFVPAWFGVSATIFLALLTYECTFSSSAAVAAAGIMAVIPAHIMRSVGGGYDNESVAMTAMLMTFYFWCRALRNHESWKWGILSGIAYIYMVASWGGYIFVLNMVAFHAGCLVLLGRGTTKLTYAYVAFYLIGTWGAMKVPVVGWAPLKSLEQLGALAVFILVLMNEFVERRRKLLVRCHSCTAPRARLYATHMCGSLIPRVLDSSRRTSTSTRRGCFVSRCSVPRVPWLPSSSSSFSPPATLALSLPVSAASLSATLVLGTLWLTLSQSTSRPVLKPTGSICMSCATSPLSAFSRSCGTATIQSTFSFSSPW
jgi:hypothetical protein